MDFNHSANDVRRRRPICPHWRDERHHRPLVTCKRLARELRRAQRLGAATRRRMIKIRMRPRTQHIAIQQHCRLAPCLQSRHQARCEDRFPRPW